MRDWKPEPEVLSRERVRTWPPLEILARFSPHVMSKSWLKFPAKARESKKHVTRQNAKGLREKPISESTSFFSMMVSLFRVTWNLKDEHPGGWNSGG